MKNLINTQTLNAPASDGLAINQNGNVWDELYRSIRTLCIQRGLYVSRILKRSDKIVKASRPVYYDKGEIIVKPAFWSSLSSVHKGKINSFNSQIENLRIQLLNAQKSEQCN